VSAIAPNTSVRSLLNERALFTAPLDELRSSFLGQKPYPFVVIPHVIAPATHGTLVEALAETEVHWQRAVTDIYQFDTYNVAERANAVGGALRYLIETLAAASFSSALSRWVGCAQSRLVSCCAHRLHHGDAIGTHTDDNAFGERFRFCLFPDSTVAFDGGAHLVEERAQLGVNDTGDEHFVYRTRVVIPYRPFQALLFRLGETSYHSVTPVHSRHPGAARLTIVATYGE
jgi:hypothetical protein